MDYAKISKDTIGHLYAGYKSLNDSPLAAELKALLELRVSHPMAVIIAVICTQMKL